MNKKHLLEIKNKISHSISNIPKKLKNSHFSTFFSINALRLMVGIIILFLLFYKVGANKVFDALLNTRPLALLLFLADLILASLFSVLILKFWFMPLKYKISFKDYTKYYLLSWALGLIVPAKLGEFSIIHYMRKKVPIGEGAAIALFSRILTLVALSCVAVFGFFIFLPFGEAIKLVGILSLVFLASLYLLFSKRVRQLVKKYILRGYAVKFKGFSKLLWFYVKKQKLLLAFLFVNVLVKWAILTYIYYLILILFGQYASFMHIFVILIMGTIAALVPISMAGLGVRESLVIFLFGQIGVIPSVILTISLIKIIFSYSAAALTFAFVKAK